ncbi:hypothetical protein [Oryzomicrobium terrae]|uniref:hypothetical protein n=1 Tax=Oryzomicrobium terrae TaxID=1735038 RepID=UPI0011ED8413|nr:hypothetical protein [Oryzomicrobium terrae]
MPFSDIISLPCYQIPEFSTWSQETFRSKALQLASQLTAQFNIDGRAPDSWESWTLSQMLENIRSGSFQEAMQLGFRMGLAPAERGRTPEPDNFPLISVNELFARIGDLSSDS